MALSPQYLHIIGRGGTAVYLVLRHRGPHGVLLAPANLCYAALYPALYAGWQVRFCDVDPETGNLTPELFCAAARQHKPDAAILPHMYGQPIRGMEKMIEFCRKEKILTIEDCASAMGAEAEYPVGKMGDYTLYSTGYAKPIQVGFGGMLTSESDDLSWAEIAEKDLPLYSEKVERTETLFSRLYRVLRNEGEGCLEAKVYEALIPGARDMFLFRLGEAEKEQVRSALAGLDEERNRRRRLWQECADAVSFAPESGLRLYRYTPGAMPWRFSLFVPAGRRRTLIEACLTKGWPVSDWYPRITPLFADEGEYPGAKAMEESILNFPLTEKTRDEICPEIGRLAALV